MAFPTAALHLPDLFNLLGVAVSAVGGTLEARRKRMDIFGAVVIALVASLGGGTLRDVLLQHGPVFWVAEPRPVLVALIAAVATFVAAASPGESVRRGLLLADAGGLALFTISGLEKALTANASPFIALVMGVITGVAGGIGRDILCNEIPLVLRRDIYATAAIAGCLLFLGLRWFQAPVSLTSIASILTILAIRIVVIRWKLTLPRALQPSLPEGRASQDVSHSDRLPAKPE